VNRYLALGSVISPARLVSDGHTAAADGFTRPPFAHLVGIHEMRDSIPLGRGRHHYFPQVLQRHVVEHGASCSFKIPMICSSEKRPRFMLWSYVGGQSELQPGLNPWGKVSRHCQRRLFQPHRSIPGQARQSRWSMQDQAASLLSA
jgi:hypothetical protein